MRVTVSGSTLYVADDRDLRILTVDSTDGTVASVSGSGVQGTEGGDAASSQWESPWGMALTSDGTRLYVAERTASTVRSVAIVPPPSDVEWAVTSQVGQPLARCGCGCVRDRVMREEVPCDLDSRPTWAAGALQLVGRDVGKAVATDAFGSAFVTGTRWDAAAASWATFVRKVRDRVLHAACRAPLFPKLLLCLPCCTSVQGP